VPAAHALIHADLTNRSPCSPPFHRGRKKDEMLLFSLDAFKILKA
jgi:hypothetical protein